jgi:hypothetical protein
MILGLKFCWWRHDNAIFLCNANHVVFDLFWPNIILSKIVIKTNLYTKMAIDAFGNTMEGPK